jgi:predicted dehydrogenase
VVLASLDEVRNHADAAIVAVPHQMHSELACQLLDAGVHVLVEKPMATSTAECEAMMAAASRGGAVLEVGLMRRHAPANRWLADLLHEGILGNLEYVDVREGYVFDWPVATAGFFSAASGGVLMDTGAHTLDLVSWLVPDLHVESYRDDAIGGGAANCRVDLTSSVGTRVVVELSRTRLLRNSVIVVGRAGSIEVDLFGGFVRGSSRITDRFRAAVPWGSLRTRCVDDLFDLQLEAWIAAVRGQSMPAVGGVEAAKSVTLIQECARVREPLEYPWDPEPASVT